MNSFARRGYVVISIDYRKRTIDGTAGQPSDAAVRDTYEDASAAIKWILDHAAEYRIDPNAIVTAGWSAGAITSMNLAYWDEPDGEFDPGEHIVAAAAVGGFLWPGGGEIDTGEPPAGLIQGKADGIVPWPLATRTCELADAADVDCTVSVIEGGSHWPGTNAEVEQFLSDFFLANGLAERGYCGVVPEPPPTDQPTSTTTPTTMRVSPPAKPVPKMPRVVG